MKENKEQYGWQCLNCSYVQSSYVKCKKCDHNEFLKYFPSREVTEEKRNEGMKVDVLQEAYKYRDAISAEMEPLVPKSISPESREYHLDGIVKGFLQACQQFKLIQSSPSPDKPEH